MVKHNNQVPNQHFHKAWQFRVKINFNQAAQKLRRRQKRKEKAAAIAPRPVGLLRPSVYCPTQQYNSKLRAGRGFTLQELKEAGISKKVAGTIGIAVDHRRSNRSAESLQRNVARLKEYQSKLVVFPRKAGKVKKGDASVEETKNATQLKGKVLPVTQPTFAQEYMDITADVKKVRAVVQLKQAIASHKLEGKRRFKKEGEEEEDAPAADDN